MKVWMIKEECHGYIGLASTLEKAADFLITTDWINSGTEDYKGHSLEFYHGEHWKEAVLHTYTVSDFEDFGFYIREVSVYD